MCVTWDKLKFEKCFIEDSFFSKIVKKKKEKFPNNYPTPTLVKMANCFSEGGHGKLLGEFGYIYMAAVRHPHTNLGTTDTFFFVFSCFFKTFYNLCNTTGILKILKSFIMVINLISKWSIFKNIFCYILLLVF